MDNPHVLIVGAGLSGATIAREYADNNIKVHVIDKRNHIGGNVYDFIDETTGIRVCKYGAHIFHTNDEEVWNYVNRFSEWKPWYHRVLADVSGTLVPVPVNINTINILYNTSIQSQEEGDSWLKANQIPNTNPQNSEDVALGRVGLNLYNNIFKNYTYKQWAKTPKELEPSVLERIPVRNNFDDRYFTDKFQGLPVNGYTNLVKNMLNHPDITIQLQTDWSSVKQNYKTIIFTGPIDSYFQNAGLPQLEYRSINFTVERKLNAGYHQINSVINYPATPAEYTRCVEYKHFLHQKSHWTYLSYESTCSDGEPYYPVPTQTNREIYAKYCELAESERKKGVHFIGRLASYKYFNMDEAIRNSLDYFKTYLIPK